MKRLYAEASAVIDAKPEEMYEIMTDYRVEHPRILPKDCFRELVIEEGGRGAGTVFRVRTRLLGVEQTRRMVVSEPEPGRVIAEHDLEAVFATTFTFTPVQGGQKVRLRIASEWEANRGIAGLLEAAMAPSALRRVFVKELQQIADYVRSKRRAVEGVN